MCICCCACNQSQKNQSLILSLSCVERKIQKRASSSPDFFKNKKRGREIENLDDLKLLSLSAFLSLDLREDREMESCAPAFKLLPPPFCPSSLCPSGSVIVLVCVAPWRPLGSAVRMSSPALSSSGWHELNGR